MSSEGPLETQIRGILEADAKRKTREKPDFVLSDDNPSGICLLIAP